MYRRNVKTRRLIKFNGKNKNLTFRTINAIMSIKFTHEKEKIENEH